MNFQYGDYEYTFISSGQLNRSWAEVENALRRAFGKGQFIGATSIEDPVNDTLMGARGDMGSRVHLVATDSSGQIVAGWFNLPDFPATGTTCGVGWFFIDPGIPRSSRGAMIDLLWMETSGYLRFKGYVEIETTIGTEAGLRVLTERLGAIHRPIEGWQDRWVIEL